MQYETISLVHGVQRLYETLEDDSEEKCIKAANVIRSLVKDIILTPVNGRIEIDVRFDLAGILTLSVKKEKPRSVCSGVASKFGCGGRI